MGERGIEKWRNYGRAGWCSAMIEGWLAILRVFPPPMAVALPTGRPPTFKPSLASLSTSQKAPPRPPLLPPRWCELKGANSRSFEIQDRKLDGRLPPIEIPAKRERYEGGTTGLPPARATVWRIVVTIPHLRPATPSWLPSCINARAHAGMTWMPLWISAWCNKDAMASAGLRAVRSRSYRLVVLLVRRLGRG